MAYVACPSCSADFFSPLDMGDFVCPGCKQYFRLENIDGEMRNPQVHEDQTHSINDVLYVEIFDNWAENEAAWMSENALEVTPFEVTKKADQKWLESDKQITELSFEANKTLPAKDNPENGVLPLTISLQSISTAEVDDEPALFKFVLPIGTVTVVAQYAFEPLNPILFILVSSIWMVLSIVGIAFWFGLGGGGRVNFGVLSSLSLGVFSLIALLAVFSGVFSGGNGSVLYNDCVEVGRYGEVKCF